MSTPEKHKRMPLTALRDLAKVHICLQALEECHNESNSQRAGSLKSEAINISMEVLCQNLTIFR